MAQFSYSTEFILINRNLLCSSLFPPLISYYLYSHMSSIIQIFVYMLLFYSISRICCSVTSYLIINNKPFPTQKMVPSTSLSPKSLIIFVEHLSLYKEGIFFSQILPHASQIPSISLKRITSFPLHFQTDSGNLLLHLSFNSCLSY
jgi:hypothetical protein